MKEWYKIKGQHLKNIANKIRLYLGITGDVVPEEMETKVTEVYEAGKQDEYDALWDIIQSNGTRKTCQYLFGSQGWTNENFKPKYDIQPTDALGLFILTGIVDVRESTIGVKLDLSKATRTTNLFSYASTKYLGVMNLQSSSGTLDGVFQNSAIISIEELVLKNDGSQTPKNMFTGCSALEHMIVKGKIGKNGFNVSACTKLDLESLLSILEALQDKSSDTSGTSWVCTLGSTNLAKLSDEQKQIATSKGWSLV